MNYSFEKDILANITNSIKKCSSNTAFFISGEYYTYQEFGQRISATRQYIKSVSDSSAIWGLALHDDLNTYASIIALWMEGKCYVPLHPNWPKDRIDEIINQTGCRNILDCCSYPYSCDYLDDWRSTDGDELAYILFTSGSTGVPKGVQISRKNIAAFIDSFWKTGINITEEDRCMQLFDLSFDVSVQSFLVALIRGASIYTAPYGQLKYLVAAELMQKHKATFGAMAPSMLTYLRPYFRELDASSLKTCILTAEACTVDLLNDWIKCASNAEIYDFYGPTEATVYCTYYKVNRNSDIHSFNGIVSIGTPMANVEAIIVGDNGSEIFYGAGQSDKGELCVAGDQVTKGYWDNEEKNKSSFFVKNNIRYYHTGDLCFWDESGNIMYSGRIDHQAKIQGFRVELGEIEFHAREYYHNEKRAIAIAFLNQQNLSEIALFIESHEDDSKDLLTYLRKKMPNYMIPTRILFEDSFPLNKNEKIDRTALKQKLIDYNNSPSKL